MSEPSNRSPLAPPEQGSAAATQDRGGHGLALLRRSPERLEQLFRHIRTQPEGAYLLDLVRRYRRQMLS